MIQKKFLIIIVGGILLAACSTAYLSLTAKMPDLTTMSDGVYRGNYDVANTPIKVTLDTTIQSYKIIEIKIIEHQCSPVGKKAEKIIDKIIKQQSLDVDVVSGATISSKAILKAVENALQ